MMKHIKTRRGFLFIVMFGFILGGTFSLANGEVSLGNGGTGADSVYTGKLDNGIPVFIQESTTSSVRTLKLFFKGQAQFAPRGKEGIENMTLSLLSHGSEDYSWDQVQTMLYRRSSSVGPFADNFDYSGYSLTTLDKYYEEIYDLFVDELLNPSWEEEEFVKVQNTMLMARTQTEADPYSYASLSLSDQFFGTHPYQNDLEGTLESLPMITLEDLKGYYADFLVPDRVFFVAVGDFEAEELISELNRDFGSLEMTGLVVDDIPGIDPVKETRLIKEPFYDSPDLAYVRGNFTLPDMSREESAALDLALSILDDILFQVVRTENSACYSVWSNLYSYSAGFGCFGVFKTQVPYDVDELIWQAVDILASGRCLSDTIEGDDPYVPVEEALEFYKAQFVTDYFIDQQTSSSIAVQMGKSYIDYGDPEAYKTSSDFWYDVTAQDIIDVINRYIVDKPVLWIVLGGEEVL